MVSVMYATLFMAVMWAALFPALSASLDHHAVERHPQHGHVYPGGVPVAHDHGYQAPHSHGAGGLAGAPGGITILPASNDATGAGIFNLVSLGLAFTLLLFVPTLYTIVRPLSRGLPLTFLPGTDTPPPRFAF